MQIIKRVHQYMHPGRSWYQRSRHAIKYLTIHHSAYGQDGKSNDQRLNTMARWHTGNPNYWPSLSYHFIITRDGKIYQINNYEDITWHDGRNRDTLGILVDGYFHPPVNERPSSAQLESLDALTSYLLKDLKLGRNRIKGHREFSQTACPGNLFYPIVQQLRKGPISNSNNTNIMSDKQAAINTIKELESFNGSTRTKRITDAITVGDWSYFAFEYAVVAKDNNKRTEQLEKVKGQLEVATNSLEAVSEEKASLVLQNEELKTELEKAEQTWQPSKWVIDLTRNGTISGLALGGLTVGGLSLLNWINPDLASEVVASPLFQTTVGALFVGSVGGQNIWSWVREGTKNMTKGKIELAKYATLESNNQRFRQNNPILAQVIDEARETLDKEVDEYVEENLPFLVYSGDDTEGAEGEDPTSPPKDDTEEPDDGSEPVDDTIPSGFELVKEAKGVQFYKKDDIYVQKINLDEGAKVHFDTTDVVKEIKGVYGGKDYLFERETVVKQYNKLKAEKDNLFSVSNGAFFGPRQGDNGESLGGISFPMKNDELYIEGYAGGSEFGSQKLVLEINGTDAEIRQFKDNNPQIEAGTAIVGLDEEANKQADTAVGRTFISASDDNGDGKNETILILVAKALTQGEAADILHSFGAIQPIMLDGGGSSQLMVKNAGYLLSARGVPAFLTVTHG